MNKIEQNLLLAIDVADEYIEGTPILNKEWAAKKCYIELEKHSIGLVLFIKENNYVLYKDDLWYKKGDYSPLKQKEYLTEQQLFNNYISGLGDL
jgi:hypothetical protein